MSEPAANNTALVTSFGLGLPDNIANWLDNRPALIAVLQALLLLLVFVSLEKAVFWLSRLPIEAYFEAVLMAGLFNHPGWPVLIMALAAFVLLSRYGDLFRRWESLQYGSSLRAFVLIVAVGLAWPLSTYGYNYYFDQSHAVDRLALVALLPLLWFRPAFIFPFILVALLLMWQFGLPSLGGSIFAHKLQIVHVLNMFAAFFASRCLFGEIKSGTFVFLTCCLIATSYWLPALGKIQIDWLQHANLYLIPPAAHAHGWLAELGSDAVIKYSQLLQYIGKPIAVFAIVLEALFLLFLLRRRVSIALLAGAILFHIGVFAIYGFFFWTWALVDTALIFLLVRLHGAADPALYSKSQFILSIVLISAGALWAFPPKLGWHDTRLTYTYRIDAYDSTGQRWPLRADYFSPYDESLTFGAFSYLSEATPVLTGSYGVTKDGAQADAINSAGSAGEVFALEAAASPVRYSNESADQFYEFVARYIANRERRGAQLVWLQRFSPPPQFWGFKHDDKHHAAISEISVSQVTQFFDGERMLPIRDTELKRFSPQATTSSRPGDH